MRHTNDFVHKASFVSLLALALLGCASKSGTLSPENGGDGTAEAADTRPCARGDLPGCEKRCTDGHGPSCTMLGDMYKMGFGVTANLASSALSYERACKAGDLEGCRYLGHAYAKGLGVQKNTAKANELFTQVVAGQRAACERGSGEGCFLLGYMVEHGLSVPADEAEAKRLRQKSLDLHEKACSKGVGESCARAGEMLEGGVFVAKDLDRAVKNYTRGCTQKDAESCRALGAAQIASGAAEKGAASLETSCELGSSAGCSMLAALLSEDGNGVPKDPTRSIELFKKACKGPGDIRIGLSCHAAAEMLAAGTVVPRDEGAAAALYGEACEQGYLNGCLELGRMHAAGRVVAHDEQKALGFFLKACDEGQGHPVACNEAGFAYENGKGAPQDPANAAVLYEMACRREIYAGCSNLGMLFATGRGAAKNDARAVELFGQACAHDIAPACVNLGELAIAGRAGKTLDDTQVVKLFAIGCNAGIAIGCNDLAFLTFKGRGVKKDVPAARTLFEKACKGGVASACENVKAIDDGK